jgi:hypothetical protein
MSDFTIYNLTSGEIQGVIDAVDGNAIDLEPNQGFIAGTYDGETAYIDVNLVQSIPRPAARVIFDKSLVVADGVDSVTFTVVEVGQTMHMSPDNTLINVHAIEIFDINDIEISLTLTRVGAYVVSIAEPFPFLQFQQTITGVAS